MDSARCLTAVSPNPTAIQRLNLHNVAVNETIGEPGCTNRRLCVCMSLSPDEWKCVDSLLHKRKRLEANGWEIVADKDELFKLYILSQVLYNEIEGPIDRVVFDFPDPTDLVKILWRGGNAVGFYTLKVKDSIVFDTMEVYGMTTLDTAYVRKTYRRNGFGLSILEDIVKLFPEEDIGISTPVSLSMYYVSVTHPPNFTKYHAFWNSDSMRIIQRVNSRDKSCFHTNRHDTHTDDDDDDCGTCSNIVVYKFLSLNPSYKTKLWEISGVGSEGNRKLIYFSIKKLFNF